MDAVSVIVYPDPMLLNLIELTFDVSVSVLTQSEVESLCHKLELVLGDKTNMVLRELKIEQKTGEAVLVFYVETVVFLCTFKIFIFLSILENFLAFWQALGVMTGVEVENLLNDRFWKDSRLGALVSNVRTMLCQNKCSGHGICNSATRACMCDTFWMPDVFYLLGVHTANCGNLTFLN